MSGITKVARIIKFLDLTSLFWDIRGTLGQGKIRKREGNRNKEFTKNGNIWLPMYGPMCNKEKSITYIQWSF